MRHQARGQFLDAVVAATASAARTIYEQHDDVGLLTGGAPVRRAGEAGQGARQGDDTAQHLSQIEVRRAPAALRRSRSQQPRRSAALECGHGRTTHAFLNS